MSHTQSWFVCIQALSQSPSVPLSPLPLAPHPHSRPLFRLLLFQHSPFLAVLKVRRLTQACRRLSASLMPPLRTLLHFNSHILHRGKRRLHLIITRSLRCTRVSRIVSAAGHCPCSAMFSSLRRPCRHSRLRPCRVSRQTLHYRRLRSATHRLCCSPPHPLSTSHPHNSTCLTGGLSVSSPYLLSFFAFDLPHFNSTLSFFLVFYAITRLIYSPRLKMTTIQRGTTKKKSRYLSSDSGPVPPTSIDLYPLRRTHYAHIHMSISHTPRSPSLGRCCDDRYPSA